MARVGGFFALISILILTSIQSVAAIDIPLRESRLNPKLALTALSDPHVADAGFSGSFTSGEVRIDLKGTRIPDRATARRMTAVELSNIEGLYRSKASPYRGQITELVQCDPKFDVARAEFPLAGSTAQLIMGGANSRRLMGACAKDQTDYLAAYFNFYDRQAQMVVEARLFLKLDQKTPQAWKRAQARLKALAQDLFTPQSQP